MNEPDQRRKDERRKQRQLSQRRSSYNANSNDSSDASQRHSNDLSLDAMLLELQRRGVRLALYDRDLGAWAIDIITGATSRTYYGRSPLAAVVQAYRAVVSESNDKEERG
jgi:hypothetical protein